MGTMFWRGRTPAPVSSPSQPVNQPIAPDISGPCEPEQPAYTIVQFGDKAGTQVPADDLRFQVEGDAILFVGGQTTGTGFPPTGVRFFVGDPYSIPVRHGLLLQFCKPFKEFWVRYNSMGFNSIFFAIVFRPGVLDKMTLPGNNAMDGIPES
jgi:hypothetical protein